MAADVTKLTGAGVTLISETGSQSRLCVSDDVAARIEDLHFTLGEGPCLDAYRQDQPVLEPDLAHSASSRWIGFAAPAVRAGARALFAFPVRVGSVRLGALSLYRDQPGPLLEEQRVDALLMAEVAADAVLHMQANAPAGDLPVELLVGVDMRAVVHQAAGMISGQLDVSVDQALTRLRAFAFANDSPIAEVANKVVARDLRLADQS